MKTAISLPDLLFEAGENFAKARGLTRSDLYSRALKLYLQTHQPENITEALDAIYDKESSALDPKLASAQFRTLLKEDW